MLESYTLMYKDIEVGIITYDEKLDKFAFELNKNIKIVLTKKDFMFIVLDKDKCNEQEKYFCEVFRELWFGVT